MKKVIEDVPVGVRLKADEEEFKIRSKDPMIEPDRVTSPVQGYFRIPAIWVGEAPAPETIKVLNPVVHHAKVFKEDLKCGIKVSVQRDGLFLFDFKEWPLAPMVVLPGYRKPNLTGPYTPPPDREPIGRRIEEYAVIRAQVLNLHQVCLTTSEDVVKRRTAAMGFPITTWNTHTSLSFDIPPNYRDDREDIRAMAHNVLNNKDKVPRESSWERRVIEIEVIKHSFQLLDDILVREPKLLPIIEAAYISAIRVTEYRYGEALTLAWGACEQLITFEWQKMLEDHKRKDASNMPKGRKKKLEGRDYTASVMVEMLEVAGRINKELYKKLETARKARNFWVHDMKTPNGHEVRAAIDAIIEMLWQGSRTRIRLQTGFRGSPGAGTPYWLWARLQPQKPQR